MAILNPPTGLSVSAIVGGSMQLLWTNNDSYYSIEIWRAKDYNSGYSKIDTIGGGNESYIDSGLIDGTRYYYFVRAYIKGDYGDSNYDYDTTDLPAPSNLNATVQNPNKIKLTWNNNSSVYSYIKIERKQTCPGTGSWSQINKISGGSTVYYDNSVIDGRTYQYRVRAEKDPHDVHSNYSNTDSGTTGLKAPTNLSGTSGGEGTYVDLEWYDNSQTENGYEIYRNGSKVHTTGANATSWRDTGVNPKTTYHYKVRAIGPCNNSGYTDEIEVYTGAPPNAPSNLTAEVISSSQINLAWQDNSGDETGFKIEEKVGDGSFSQIDTVGKNVTSYQRTGLSPGTQYTYRVRAYNASGNSGYSNEAGGTTHSNIEPPTNLEATPVSDTEIEITFKDNSLEEDSHHIERKLTGGSYSEVKVLEPNRTYWKDSLNQILNGSFENWSSGDNSDPDSWTSWSSGMTHSIAKEFDYVKLGNFSAKLTRNGANCVLNQDIHEDEGISYWQEKTVMFQCWVKCNTASSARILINDGVLSVSSDYHSGNNSWELLTVSKTIDANATMVRVVCQIVNNDVSAYFDGALSVGSGDTYYYRVRAKQGANYSNYSNEASATIIQEPSAPTSLQATAESDEKIRLNWTGVDKETGYKIEQSNDQGSDWSEIAVIGADIENFLVTGLNPNTRYDFRIWAYNAAGNSGYSNEAHATTNEIYTRTEFEKFMRNPNAKPVFLAEINPKMQLTGLSLVSGKTYTYEYEITDRGIDIEAVYENGVAYSEVSSIISVENSASTFYCDYYNRKLYIHTSDGTEPDNFYLEASFLLYFSSYQTKTGTIIYNGNYYFPYLDLENIPDISSEIKRLYEGNISLSSGNLVVRNARQGDGTFFFDRKFEKYIWRNRKVRLKAGKKDFNYTNFQTIYTGLIEDVVCEDRQISFSLVDIREGIWRNLPINKLWQSNYPDLPDEEQGVPIPVLFGSIQNAPMVCIDSANKKYKFHDGRVKSVTEVRDKDGNALTENTDYYVDLQNAVITFDRDNYAIGDDDFFIIDFEGIPDSANNLIQNGAEVFKYIYNTYLELENSELDLDSIYQTKYEKEKNLNIFMYLQKSSNTYIREIEHSLEAYSFQDEEGRIGLRTFGSTAPSDAKYIANHQIFDYSQEKKKKDILYKVNIFYNENPQNQSWEVKSFFSNPVKWGFHIYEDIDIYTRLTTESEVDTLGGNILGLLNKPTINFAVHNVLYGCSAGDIVRLTRNRYYNSDGSASEKPIRILQIDKSYSSGKTTIMAEEV